MDAIAQYQQAVNELRTAKSRAQSLSLLVKRGADALGRWQDAMVSNASGGFPAEIGLNRNAPSINAAEWPTGQQIADVLAAYHQARQAADRAYNAIPEGQRSVVQPPERLLA